MSKEEINKFVTKTSIIFKSYDHQVVISKNKSNLWHFSSNHSDKKYNIYCTLNLSKVRSLIKIALRKTATETRLVVICSEHTDEEKTLAEEAGYSLIDIKTLQTYGNDIIEARAKEAMSKATG